MSPLLVLVTTAALGVEVGWEPLPTGGHEYTIQIEPQLLGVLERGTEEIFSEVPPEIDVRRYRIKVGTGQLPRDAGPPAAAVPQEPDRPPPAEPAFDDFPPAENYDPGGPSADPIESPSDNTIGSPALPPPPGSDEPDLTEMGAGDSRAALPNEPERSDMSADVPGEQPPGPLPNDVEATGPIEQAGFDAEGGDSQDTAPVETRKPALPEGPARPWSVLVGSIVLLCCSLGANAYLGWIAWDARHRFRDTVAKLRTAS